MAGIAGCLGDDDDPGAPGDGDDDGNGDDPEAATIDTTVSYIPDDMNFNQYQSGTSGTTEMNQARLDWYGSVKPDGSLHYRAAESLEFDEDTNSLLFTIRDDINFWDGREFTAEDLWTVRELERLQNPEGHFYESVEQEGDYAVRFTYKEPQNPQIRERFEINAAVIEDAEVWGEWLERYQDASDQDARDEISAELGEWEITVQDVMDDSLGTSPFELVSADEQSIVYERRDNHRHSDQIEIERLRYNIASEAARDELILGGDIDFEPFVLEPTYEEGGPGYLENIVRYESRFLIKMMTNWSRNEALQERGVRRAMASVINTADVQTNFERGFPIEVHSGMDRPFTEAIWGDQLDSLIDYSPQESDYEKADQYLESAGYTREDGSIYDSNDEEVDELVFMAESDFDRYFIPGQTAYRQLEDYGFNIEFQSIDRTTKLNRAEEEMDWDLALESHYADHVSHPYYYFHWGTIWGYQITGGNGTLFGPATEDEQKLADWIEQGEEFSGWNRKPLTPEIPVEIGAETLDGETKEINVYELIREIETTPVEAEREEEIIRDLSWMWNFNVPEIDLLGYDDGFWGNTRDFDWPDQEEHDYLQIHDLGGYFSIQDGLVSPSQ